MRQVLRRAMIAAAVGALLTGCSSTVVGTASPGPGEPVDVSASDFPITGAVDGEVDQATRDALADLNTFWQQEYPQAFHGPFKPLDKYFSVDSKHPDPSAYPRTGIGCPGNPVDPSDVADNAQYERGCNVIAYDRALLQKLSDSYGRSLPAVVMAHEFGHAIQDRANLFGDRPTIQTETQADCFAGAWTAWVVAGNAQHVAIRKPDLDDVLRGYLQVADKVGSNPNGEMSHGSYFDRISAIQEGFTKGVTACRDDFGDNRLFTEKPFTQRSDAENQGNAPYSQIRDIINRTLPPFWQGVFPAAFHKNFDPPMIKPFQGTGPNCGGQNEADLDLYFCPADRTVNYDEKDLVKPAYKDIGDFAVVTAISLPYAEAARSELNLSTGDAAATKSAVCLTGWYEAQLFNGAYSDVGTLSPGDIDEAVEFILKYGVSDKVFPHVRESGFELVGAYRDGFLNGGKGCDVGL